MSMRAPAEGGIMMLVQCPNCGQTLTVNGLGRPSLNMPVIKVYDALRHYRSVTDAARELGCSRAYIYKILKANGLTQKDLIENSETSIEF
jgi:transposase-like protein